MTPNVKALLDAVVDALLKYNRPHQLMCLLEDPSPDSFEKVADQVRPINADLAAAISYAACAYRPWHVKCALLGAGRAGDIDPIGYEQDHAVEMFKRLGVECKLV